MRELKYAVEGKQANLKTVAMDDRGSGNANHIYYIMARVQPALPEDTCCDGPTRLCSIEFQNGPIKEAGINGVQNEDLIAICIDRLEGFQGGPYACQDNQDALDALRVALEALQRRTRARIARGVDGTHKK